MLNSLIACVVGLITPIALVVPLSVNQTLPSGPAAIPSGMLPAFKPALNSLITCVFGLIIPTALVVPGSLNHMLPSGPIAIERTALPGFRPLVNLLITPSGRDPTDRAVPVAEPQVAVRARLNLGRIGPGRVELDDLPERCCPGDAGANGEHGSKQRYRDRR